MSHPAILAAQSKLPPRLVPDPEDLARVQRLIGINTWVFAKSMPDTPHHYTLRKTWAVDQDFIDVVHFIRKFGFDARWPAGPKGRVYRYMDIDGHRYWTMGCPCVPGPYDPKVDTILINRRAL